MTGTTLAIIGAGQRGTTYARVAAARGARVVAVAEPQAEARERFAARYDIAPDKVFGDWRELLAGPRLADVAVICTQDREHAGPAVAAAGLGYHLLIEKPMATDPTDARAIVDAVERAGVIATVCHVLRYTPYTIELRRLLREGVIGTPYAMQHLEPVGWWHFAHSFVRGNWRSAAKTSPSLVQKSVHDIDWMAYIMGEPVARVSSFGSLIHFRPANRPAGAADRCVDCAVGVNCPYNAVRLYEGFLTDPAHAAWPLTVLMPTPTAESVRRALREGPYGECVYLGANDVVDHQVVSVEFPSGANASFMMVAFTEMANRKTRLFGSRGWLEGDGRLIRVHDFVTDTRREYDTQSPGSDAAAGHGGGDEGLVAAFLAAVESGDQSRADATVQASLASLQVVWAAERARTGRTVESIPV